MNIEQLSSTVFENRVLHRISKFDFDRAEFYNNTLFVETTNSAACDIFLELYNTDLGHGKYAIEMSCSGGEYAYDFVG